MPHRDELRGWVGQAPGVHGSSCSGAKWVSSSAVACVAPAGVGAELDVTIAAGPPQVTLKSFCRSQFPHKSVHLSFTITNIKNELTNLCRN